MSSAGFYRRHAGEGPSGSLCLADREDTEADRLYFRANVADAQRAACGGRYARRLKHLITFMHYGMRPSDVTREDFELFADVRAHLTTPSRKTRLPAEENGSTHICA